MRVVDTVRTTRPLQPAFFDQISQGQRHDLVRVDERAALVHRADPVGVAIGHQAEVRPSRLTAPASAPRYRAIGSGCTLPNPGFISPRISATSQPVPCKMDLITPRPDAVHRIDHETLRVIGDDVYVDQLRRCS